MSMRAFALAVLLLAPLQAAALPLCPPGPRDNCVVDGDTFWWGGEKMRLEDIDAPEVRGRCKAERHLARLSTLRLADLLASPFTVEVTGRDRYERALVIARRAGESVGAILVDEGLAEPWAGRRGDWCGR